MAFRVLKAQGYSQRAVARMKGVHRNTVRRVWGEGEPREYRCGPRASKLDELAWEGACEMLVRALEAEVAQYLEQHGGERDDQGHALVVRNGKARARRLTQGAGTIEIQAPRVSDRRTDEDGGQHRFTSKILPPYMHRSPKVSEVQPILYLRGLSSGDLRPALGEGLLLYAGFPRGPRMDRPVRIV